MRDRGLDPLLDRALECELEIPRSEISLLERLQSGGISSCTVFKGKWKGVAVAMKVPRCEQGDRAHMVLEVELGLLSQLQHPRLVSLLGVQRPAHPRRRDRLGDGADRQRVSLPRAPLQLLLCCSFRQDQRWWAPSTRSRHN
jgi:hypothetical protein